MEDKLKEEWEKHKASKDKPKEEWKEAYRNRIIEKDEIIIEDLPEREILTIAGKMKQQGYSLEYWKSPKQKSGHLHIKNIHIPKDSTIELSNKYKELIIKKYVREELWEKVDWNFYNRSENAEPHRIATENMEHYKGYGVKTLIKTWGDSKENPFEEKIWKQAEEEIEESKIIEGDTTDYDSLIEKILPNWIEGKRQELCLSFAGYLRKEKKLGIEKVKQIINSICIKKEDTEIQMRMKAVDETFKKDEKNIKGISGLEFLKEEKKKKNKEKEEKKNYISSFIDKDNKIIVEQIHNKTQGSWFCIYNHNTKKITNQKTWNYNGKKYYPHYGEEIDKGAILLPSGAKDYDEDELNKKIEDFINKWLDVPEDIVKFGVWNTKRSWVYEAFHNLNYLRFLGDTGMGKSRGLFTFGSIHYKPIFTSGAATTAPLFRIIDKWRGTLVMDEADLKESDESNETIKIINQGFEKNSFIMRCDQNDPSKINFFDPYGPKILATRRPFTDKATESRCITHVMAVTERKNIPVNLNDDFYKESMEIRNQLLMWRFRNYFEIDLNKKFDLGDLEPRVKQIVSSYIALFSKNEKQMEEFKDFIQNYQEDLIEERQSSFEGAIVGAIHSLIKNMEKNITAQRIIEVGEFSGRNGKPMQPRALNSYLKSLGFKKSQVTKIDGKAKRCIPINENHINKIFDRYGYEVTKVTVDTEISKNNNNSINDKNKSLNKDLGYASNQCNLRNFVTDVIDKKDNLDIDFNKLNLKKSNE